jgi:hypothetical protein
VLPQLSPFDNLIYIYIYIFFFTNTLLFN